MALPFSRSDPFHFRDCLACGHAREAIPGILHRIYPPKGDYPVVIPGRGELFVVWELYRDPNFSRREFQYSFQTTDVMKENGVKITELTDAIKDLSNKDLNRLREEIRKECLSRNLKSTLLQKVTKDEEMFYVCITEALNFHRSRRSKEAPLPVFVRNVQNRTELRRATECVFDLVKVMQDAEEGEMFLTDTQRVKLYGTIAILTIEWLQEFKAPVSMKTVLRCRMRYGGLLDRAFPGYGMTKAGWSFIFAGARSKTASEAIEE